MAHDHHHDEEAYYKEQLSTIALCGMLGGVCVMLYAQGKLSFLAPNFQLPVLLTLVLIVVVSRLSPTALRGGR